VSTYFWFFLEIRTIQKSSIANFLRFAVRFTIIEKKFYAALYGALRTSRCAARCAVSEEKFYATRRYATARCSALQRTAAHWGPW
jgi:hypothetical protein